MKRFRRSVGSIAALTLAVGAVTALPAAAAPVDETIDGITYTADDADVAAGATVTDFDYSTTDVTIPDTVEINGTDYDVVEIAEAVFNGKVASSGAPLTSLTIGNNVTEIGNRAFLDNDLTTLTLPDSVTYIGLSAFGENNLTDLTLSESLTRLSSYAFRNNNLTSVTVPAAITRIDSGAFGENPGLQSVRFMGEVLSYVAEESAPIPAFDTSSGSLVLSYAWRYGDPQASGGFTSPTWEGYATQAIATVNFDLNGHGATTPADQEVAVGETADEPSSDPLELGFDFTGWYTDSAATTEFDFTGPITADTTLYAGWEEVADAGDIVTVTKTVDASFVRVHDWDLTKTGQVGEITTGDDTASAEVDYTVTATPGDFRDDYYLLSGEITVTNEIVETLNFTVTDTPDVGVDATCEVVTPDGELAENVTISGDTTVTFDYTCTLDGLPEDGTNTATVSWFSGEEQVSVTEDVEFTQRAASFDTVTLVDDQTTPDQGWETLGEADWNADGTATEFNYTLTQSDLAIGECTSFTNVAMITETEQTTDATLEICPDAVPTPEPTQPEPTQPEPTQPEPEPTAPQAEPALPKTGADVQGASIAALLLLSVGGLALTLRRRQRN